MSFTTRRLSANRLVVYDLLRRSREYHAPMLALVEWDVTDTLARIDALRAAGQEVGLTALLVKATGMVVRAHERLRTRLFHGVRGPFEATFDEVSCNLPVYRRQGAGELLFPVTLRDVDTRPVEDIAAALLHYKTAPLHSLEEVARLRALERVPRPLTLLHDYKVRSDPKYFIERFGCYGLSSLVHGQSGAIGVVVPGPGTIFYPNHIDERPSVVDGAIVPRKKLFLTFTVDHQVLDGMGQLHAALELKKLVEDPSHILGHL